MGKQKPIALGQKDSGLPSVQRYLIRYGYMSGASPFEAALEDNTSEALLRLQRFNRLPETGEADHDTLAFIETPRCGIRDWRGPAPMRPCRWPVGQNSLIYEFGNETSDLPPGQAFTAVQDAIDIWNAVLGVLGIPLELRRRVDEGVVHVRFDWQEANGEADLLSGTPVAHADLPPACGQITGAALPKPVSFDDGHRWHTSQVSSTFHVGSVAMHEIGHILGLVHSRENGSVMIPTLPEFHVLGLPSEGDRANLVALYS